MAVDLPALLRPTNAISGSSLAGSWLSSLAVVTKRALCVQASAVARGGVGRGGGGHGQARKAAHCKIRALAPSQTRRQHDPNHPAADRPARGRAGVCTGAGRGAASPISPRARRFRRRSARRATPPTAAAARRPTRSSPASIPSTSVKQLAEFKAGTRKNPIMQGFAAQLSRSRHAQRGRVLRQQVGQARLREEQGQRRARRQDLARRPARPPDRGLRRLPQPERRRHPVALPAAGRPARRLHRAPSWSRFAAGARQQRPR